MTAQVRATFYTTILNQCFHKTNLRIFKDFLNKIIITYYENCTVYTQKSRPFKDLGSF